MKILVINGPNLDKLHKRNPEHYGKLSLKNIENKLREDFPEVSFTFFQSACEGELVEAVHNAENYDALIINAGAYSHYSLALRDALEMINTLKIEVHLSNIYARESFRRKSVLSEVCNGIIAGFQEEVYALAVLWVLRRKR